jgi:hypothetical protein
MRHVVAVLEGSLLNQAVAKAEGWPDGAINFYPRASVLSEAYNPSGNWAHGGPIIERGQIMLEPGWVAPTPFDGWNAWAKERHKCVRHEDPLIAAMRAYVASKFGDEVDL